MTILGMMGWDGMIAGREAGADLWSRRPGSRPGPVEFNLTTTTTTTTTTTILILYIYIYYYILSLPFKAFK